MSNSKELYSQLCCREKSISIYGQPWWLDVCCGEDNWDVILYFKNNNIVAALPYYIKRKKGFNIITIPARTQTCGLWLKQGTSNKKQSKLAFEQECLTYLFSELEKKAKEKKVKVCIQSFAPEYLNWSPLYRMGYKQTTKYTYRIESGKQIDEVKSEFTSGLRNELKHISDKAIIEEIDDVDVMYQLHKMTMERHEKKSAYTVEFIHRFDEACNKNNCRKIYIAKDIEGNIHTALYIVYDENWVYYLFGGTNPRFRKQNFPPILIYKAIEFACLTGRGFDFEGSMTPGIEEFFQKWGGEQKPFLCVSKILTKNPLLKMLINCKSNM